MAFCFLNNWASVLQTPGAVRNPDVDSWVRRRISGPLGFVASHHPKHAALKRPQSITTAETAQGAQALPVVRPFNEAGFHFGKVVCKELVAVFEEGATVLEDGLRAVTSTERNGSLADIFGQDLSAKASRLHPIFINASPFGTGHSLFVPSVLAYNPQLLTAESFRASCRMARILAQVEPDCRMGFNSLAAFASVNHCHMHVWKNSALWPGRSTMPIEDAPRTALWHGTLSRSTGNNATELVQLELSSIQWPIKGLHVAASCSSESSAPAALEASVAIVEAALSDMQPANIPHHVVVWWSSTGSGSHNQQLCLNVFVLPRAEQRPTPVPTASGPSSDLNISVALLEICGLPTVLQLQSEGPQAAGVSATQAMDSLSEADCVDILAAFCSSEWSDRVARVAIAAAERCTARAL